MRYNFPRQSIPYRQKTKEWAKDCIKFADTNSILSSSVVRKTVAHKKLNYDLLNGKLDMRDLMNILNPQGFKFERKDIHTKINHYPVVNRLINLLLGEETASQLEYKVVVTNPTAISDKEKNKRDAILQSLQQLIEDTSVSDEDYQKRLQELSKYYTYEYQDIKEIRGNELLNHYEKEQNFKNIFNDGFVDVLAVNEAIFQCSIEGGEPVLKKLNPLKVHVYGNGASNRIEDADMVVIEDYWQIGRILDTYGDQLTAKDIKMLEDLQGQSSHRDDDKYAEYGDPLTEFMYGEYANQMSDGDFGHCFTDGTYFSQLPYDIDGNVRVLQVYWKSFKKIKKVKSYDPATGKVEYNFYPESYIIDKDKGEEEQVFYINEAWQGVMIGSGERAIYVNLGPCPLQYNKLSNPSKCHFGIIGQIFNYNESKPYSIIDMTKPFMYLYDAVMDKLIRTIQNNMGKLVQLNSAVMPENWKFEDWVYYAKTAGIVLINPFKEGNKGQAKGKLGGMFNPAPVIDAELGNSIQNMVSLLQFIEQELANLIGITPQRLGAIQNRETVGGVERSTLQSSHTTRWYFEKYNDLKKRVYECFLETAKFAARGHNLKFQYITSDLSQRIIDIDGDDFAEADYGLVVSADYDIEKFRQQVEQASQMALQAQAISYSAYLKLQSSGSIAEKIKLIENNENEMAQRAREQQEMQYKMQQEQLQAQMQQKQMEMQQQDMLNQRDNETKLLIANIQASSKQQPDIEMNNNEDLNEKVREFDEKMKLERDKLQWDKDKNKDNNEVKIQIANKRKIGNGNQ